MISRITPIHTALSLMLVLAMCGHEVNGEVWVSYAQLIRCPFPSMRGHKLILMPAFRVQKRHTVPEPMDHSGGQCNRGKNPLFADVDEDVIDIGKLKMAYGTGLGE